MRSLLKPAAFAAIVISTASTFAQTPPQPPAEPLLAQASEAATLTGQVQQWLLNPNGDVDGFVLADGTQVAFPPHLSAAVLGTLALGDAVAVNGWRAPGVPVLRAASLTNTASRRSVNDEPPASPPPGARALVAMEAQGQVARVLYTDRGDINGVVLDGGAIVRFPPHVGRAMTPELQPGQALHAKGWGSRTAQGQAFEATALGPSALQMQPLSAAPGRLPPPARPPRGPAEPRPAPIPPMS